MASSAQLILDGIYLATQTKSDLLIGPANNLLITITALMISWTGIKMLLEGTSITENLSSFFSLIFIWGICAYALNNYGVLMNDLSNSFDYIANTLTGGDGKDIVSGYLTSVINMIITGFNSIGNMVDKKPTIFQVITTGGGAQIAFLMALLLNVLVFIAISAIAFIAALVIFAMYSMSIMLFLLGMILGPIFIPWLMLPPAKEYFNKWLGFMVNAGMLKVVVITIAILIQPIFTEVSRVTSLLTDSTSDWSLSFTSMLGDTVVALMYAVALLAVGAFMIIQAPSITQALLPGSIGARAPGLKDARNAAGGIQSAGNSAKSGASAAKQWGSDVKAATNQVAQSGASAAKQWGSDVKAATNQVAQKIMGRK